MGEDAEIWGSALGVEGKADDFNHSPGVNNVGDPRTYSDGTGADYNPR